MRNVSSCRRLRMGSPACRPASGVIATTDSLDTCPTYPNTAAVGKTNADKPSYSGCSTVLEAAISRVAPLVTGGGVRLSSDSSHRTHVQILSDTSTPDRWEVSNMALLADRESQLLIDGKLVAGGGGTFTTVNPATEEVLGTAADADADDMGRAIEAARRAFDDTDWSRNIELRVRCLRQLRQAMKDHIEELARHHHRRGRCAADADVRWRIWKGPVDDLQFCAEHRRVLRVEHRSGLCHPAGRSDQPHHRTRGRRRRRCHHPVELPAPDQPRQDRTRRSRPATPWCSSPRPTPRGARRCWAS